MARTPVYIAKPVAIRNILRNTYSYMTAGLLLTALISWLTLSYEPLSKLATNPMILIVAVLAEFGLVFYLSARIMNIPAKTATNIFWLYSALNGFTLSMIFRVYTGASIFHAFIVAGGAFGGMSIYALTTKKDLSGLGKYLIMGLWGVIITSFIGMFFPTGRFSVMISLVALILFMGLTAYDTQMIRKWGDEFGDSMSGDDYKRLSVIGALKLYLDFINIFLILLRFLGVARRN